MANSSLSPVVLVISIIFIFTGITSGQDSNVTDLCKIFSNVPNYIKNRVGRLDTNQMDKLDIYLADTADCNYVSQKTMYSYSFINASFEDMLEVKLALRGTPDIDIDVHWENEYYFFSISDDITLLSKVDTSEPLVRVRINNLVSQEAYQLFTIRLEKDRISLIQGCEDVIIVHNVSEIMNGVNVEMKFLPFDDSGGKLLYNCTEDGSGARYDKPYSSLCESVPSSLHLETNFNELTPNMDQLDSFMIKSTGCEYRGSGHLETVPWFDGTFETRLEQRVAVRTQNTGYIHIQWKRPRSNLFIFLGQDEHAVVKYPRTRVVLPSNLTYSSYLPIIITLDNATLSFGLQCEESSLMIRNISIERGSRVEMFFLARNRQGGKFLYNCPGNVTIARKPLCEAVPSSVHGDRNSWISQQTPTKDDLDTYQEKNTGCKYMALSVMDEMYQFQNLTFENDKQVMLALRAEGKANVYVAWSGQIRYSFGFDNANSVFSYQIDSNEEDEKSILYNLTENSYLPVYIKFTTTTLSFGVQCDMFPIFEYDLSLQRGTKIHLAFEATSNSGGKFLYNCPCCEQQDH